MRGLESSNTSKESSFKSGLPQKQATENGCVDFWWAASGVSEPHGTAHGEEHSSAPTSPRIAALMAFNGQRQPLQTIILSVSEGCI